MKTVVLAIPRVEPHRPPPGPAIVAKICQQQGHQVTAYDLNIKFYRACQLHGLDYHGFDTVFDQTTQPTPQQQKFVDIFVEHWCQHIANGSFDYVMISVFGMSGTWFATKFLTQLRKVCSAKIVIGGMGVGTVSLVDDSQCFGQRMKDLNLIDAFIVGEAEHNLVRYLNGQTGPGIDNSLYHQIDNIENLPTPDYSVYDLNDYDYLTDRKEVYITGSRGCVRKCTYCDIEKYWPKYRFRSGQSIADEIIDNYERLGIARFYFTDSLVNGSLKVFADFCDRLAQYKFADQISWSGQFIFRQRRSIPQDHFAVIAAAGAEQLYVGIETGSDRVRNDMGKNFTNEDIEFQFDQCSRYGIQLMPLMFTGYVTETLEDHRDNLKFFERFQRYVADGTIMGIELGMNLAILPGSPVAKMIDEHQMVFLLDQNHEPDITLWLSLNNIELTFREQIRRKIEVHETAIQYQWPVWRQKNRLQSLKKWIIQNELWQEKTTGYKIVDSQSNVKKTLIPIQLATS